MSIGPDTADFDYSCPHCGQGYYNDVGMDPVRCGVCGGSLSLPSVPIPPRPDDDVLDDPRFILFNDRKAFKYLRSLGLLERFLN